MLWTDTKNSGGLRDGGYKIGENGRITFEMVFIVLKIWGVWDFSSWYFSFEMNDLSVFFF